MQSQRPGSEPDCIRFDRFEANLHTEELSRDGRKVRLAHQSFRVLAVLLEKPGQLVTRQELRDRLWPGGALAEYDQGLNTAVNRLREALRDAAEAPRFIETLPKRGYRFIGVVHQQRSPSSEVSSDTAHEALSHTAGDPVTGPSCEPPAAETVNELHVSPPGTPANVPLTDQARSDIVPGAGLDRAASPLRPRLVLAVASVLVVALLVAGLVFLATRHPTARPSFGRHLALFTSLPGQEIAPTFSPDGSQIAFAWNGAPDSGGQFDLYVKSVGSERLLRLTHQPATWLTPAWSPDGSSIAFVRQMDGGPGIFVIPALGGSERSIVNKSVAVGLSIQISWSPDNRQLAYSAYGPQGSAQVYLVELDTLNTRPLTPAPDCMEADQPAFSPDGRRLALVCLSSAAVYAIYVVDLPHGPMRQIASMLGYPQGLAWAADGDHLIISNDPGDGGELWQLGLNGEMTQLPFGQEASAPAVDPKSGRIAYVRSRGTVDIWHADLTVAHPEESATRWIYSTRAQAAPRYSPDGTRIAFQSNRSGSTEIWLTDSAGADPERITSFNGPYASAPSWCSDGRRIAFDSRAPGLSAIYVEDIRERVPRKVLTTRDNLSVPAWSQDCRWLFASDNNNWLYRFPSSGGAAERFSDQKSNNVMVVGDRVVFNVLRPDGIALWTKPVNGGMESPLENMPKLRYEAEWAATVNGIYYTDSLSKPITVNLYDFATHSSRVLMTLGQTPAPAGPWLGASPDGRSLLYTKVENQQSEIVLAPAP